MQALKRFIFIIVISSLFYSCKGNNNSSALKDSTSDSGNSSSNSAVDASFSCKIDGKDFSGKGNDSYSNVAIISSPGLINFVLVPMEKVQGIPPQFNFFVADHGITTIRESGNGDYSAKYSPGGMDNDYRCKQMTVAITSSNESRVKGTFSGILIDPKSNKEIPVTEGKFDIPYSPYSKK
jgi:hypothetical protein